MASSRAVAAALALLAADRGGEVGPLKVEAWGLALSDISDDELKSAVSRFLVLDTGEFVPPVSKIYALCRPPQPIDTDAILKQISKLGSYNPNTGWQYPRVDDVRKALGDGVADAYAAAGASRCFADNANDGSSITRDIARRAFASELTITQRTNPAALPAPEQQNRLSAGTSDA